MNGKGPVLFTGPDGMSDFTTKVLGPKEYIGIGTMSPEGTSNLSYLWKPASTLRRKRYGKENWVGQIGWQVVCNINNTFKQDHRIKRGEFRQLAEDKYANLAHF